MTITTRDKLPRLILLDLTKEIRDLSVVMTDLYAPVIDKDAMLDRVFEAIEQTDKAEERIKAVAIDMAHHDGLFEHACYEDLSPRPAIEKSITELSQGIKNNLASLQVYAEGKLLYKFKGMLDATTAKIVLTEYDHPRQ